MSAAVKRACELVPSLALNPAIALVFGWEGKESSTKALGLTILVLQHMYQA